MKTCRKSTIRPRPTTVSTCERCLLSLSTGYLHRFVHGSESVGSCRHRAGIHDQAICTRIIVACETRFGVVGRGSRRLTDQVNTVLSGLPILAFESPAEQYYGKIRAALTTMGQPIGYNDLFIAAHTLALDLILVTDNTREFSRVPSLRLENWLIPTAG